MSNRRQGRTGNRTGIRGPHSALTDYLAANNISAADIRDQHRQRLEQAVQEEGVGESADQAPDGDAQAQAESSAMAAERSRKRKRDNEEAIAKIKKGKLKKKAEKKKKKKGSDDDDDYDFDDELTYKKAKKLPGQLENCELCGKRFTVTPYSKAGPDGGLLCTPCGKELAKETKANEKAAKPVQRKGRRKMESNRLDGMTNRGAKSLTQLCIEKLAEHSLDIEEFGELPDTLMKQLSEIFSRKRVMNSRTAQLFLRPDLDQVSIDEAAYLESEDFNQIFAIVQKLDSILLRNCCQFKDANIDYMIDKARHLKHVRLSGANLVSNDKWIDFFIARGVDLETLNLEWLDAAFDDQAVEALVEFCPNLCRLKLERCRQLGVLTINTLSRAQNLQHLTLQLSKEIPSEDLINLIAQIGPNLQTLCLTRFIDTSAEPTDDVLTAIHTNCHRLSKLRFTENDECTDQGYVDLFTNWVNPPLRYIDLNSTRDIDNSNPDGPEDYSVGLASDGFKAMMTHSGQRVEYLDISSCRHISHEAFTEIFDGVKQYPNLQEINFSFCQVVDTVIIAGLFRSCPNMKKVVTFGCFQVQDVVVPKGIVLIGAPRAQEAIEQFGDTVFDFEKMIGRSGLISAAA